MINPIDKVVGFFFPERGIRRLQARKALAYYEAGKPDRLRKSRRETGSADVAVGRAGASLREQARHLEQNLDIARGALATLVANTVGPHGILIEPQPRRAGGSIDTEFARQILALWRDWCKKPEVTWQHSWPAAQRLLARSWFRDGEVFAQLVAGSVPTLTHGTEVPLSLELLESDFVPFSHTDGTKIVQGVEYNGWRRPVAYWLYKMHPGDQLSLRASTELKRVPADRILHAKIIDRIGQTRGVSVFASVLNTLDDIKDYQESERVAAKVAASMAAYIKKGSPDQYDPDTSDETGSTDGQRQLKFRAGMIFDDLLPGEEIGLIDSKRPNPNMDAYVNGLLRRVAAGVSTTYSSLSKNYDGTYSAQRQELVEGFGAYGILANEFIGAIVQPVYEQFLTIAIASRRLVVPEGIERLSLDDALYIAPQMPWIDPLKEANAWAVLEANGHASGPEIIRRRGQNPNDVIEQETAWREKLRQADIEVDYMTAVEPVIEPTQPGARHGQTRRA